MGNSQIITQLWCHKYKHVFLTLSKVVFLPLKSCVSALQQNLGFQLCKKIDFQIFKYQGPFKLLQIFTLLLDLHILWNCKYHCLFLVLLCQLWSSSFGIWMISLKVCLQKESKYVLHISKMVLCINFLGRRATTDSSPSSDDVVKTVDHHRDVVSVKADTQGKTTRAGEGAIH